MTEQERFVDKGIITIVDQGLTDTLTDKDYWVEDGLEDIVELLNSLHKENEELKCLLNACKEEQQNLIKDGKKCIGGEEYNIDEIVGALNHYQKSVNSLSKENYEMYCLIEEFCLNAKKRIFDKSKNEQIEKNIE